MDYAADILVPILTDKNIFIVMLISCDESIFAIVASKSYFVCCYRVIVISL